MNPVAGSYFNFSIPEPTGVVAIICPDLPSFLGLVSLVMPVIVGGNTCILLASETEPLTSISFAEVLQTSDLPAGVINVLTGLRSELLPHIGSHMDVNAVLASGLKEQEKTQLSVLAADNVKRVIISDKDWEDNTAQGPYQIMDTQEIKTTWHPIGK